MKKIILFLSLVALTLGCVEDKSLTECSDFDTNNCPAGCVVCPPCYECSSIQCRTEQECLDIGFTSDWYDNILERITNFQECIDAGNPAMESYPRQCRAGDQTFTEEI